MNSLLPKLTVLLALALQAAPAAAEKAPNPLAPWTHVADVLLANPPAKGLVELPLPPELFPIAQPSLADLRLATAAGRPVPYLLRLDRGRPPETVSYNPTRLFNPLSTPGRQNSITVDFGARAPRTRIDVDTPGANFRRRLTVEASPDGQEWQTLRRSAWLFRIRDDGSSYDKNDVSLPDNDFRYLRLTVFHSPDDPSDVPITSVQAWHIKTTPTPAVPAPVKITEVRQDPKTGLTEITADLGFENLPLYELSAAFDDPNFLRRVEVLGRNAAARIVTEPSENDQPRRREIPEPWIPIASGAFHRFPAADGQELSQSLSLSLAGQYRYLLIRIYNADNAPLKFTGLTVSRLQHYLAFQPTPAGPYRLYLGNPAATAPSYDLPHFASRLRAEGLTTASLGPLGPNPLFSLPTKTIPWTERYSWLLWSALLLVLAVLSLLVYRQARHARSVDS